MPDASFAANAFCVVYHMWGFDSNPFTQCSSERGDALIQSLLLAMIIISI